jgi:cytochrome c oxidase cbb3-type subunit 2
MMQPRDVVPESNMPAYPWLARNRIDETRTAAKMRGLRRAGVPYTEEQIAAASDEVKGRTEMEALVAYLQGMGTAIRTVR